MQKILIIEDETPVRKNLVELLEAEGYQPLEACDGEQGVRVVWETPPDLILCDIIMPKLDGYGVLARLNRDPLTAAIPFIFITARTEREDLRRGMDLGADDFITKPFTLDEVMQAIRKRLEKRALIEEMAGRKRAELESSIQRSLPDDLLDPLSMIFGAAELLVDQPGSAALERKQVGEIAQQINRSAASLLRSIQEYILLTELEAIAADPERMRQVRAGCVASPARLISDWAAFKAAQEERENDLRLDLEETALAFSEVHLQKVIEELLESAFRFSPPGSPVEITGKTDPDHSLYQLCVTHQPGGMQIDRLAWLSDPFHPGANPVERQPRGIGMAIVRRLTALHAASLQVSTLPGQIVRVEIGIPLAA